MLHNYLTWVWVRTHALVPTIAGFYWPNGCSSLNISQCACPPASMSAIPTGHLVGGIPTPLKNIWLCQLGSLFHSQHMESQSKFHGSSRHQPVMMGNWWSTLINPWISVASQTNAQRRAAVQQSLDWQVSREGKSWDWPASWWHGNIWQYIWQWPSCEFNNIATSIINHHCHINGWSSGSWIDVAKHWKFNRPHKC